MSCTVETSFDYRHKKFDQGKRLRADSLSSSTGDCEYIKLKTELLDETLQHQAGFGETFLYNWPAVQSTLKRSLSPSKKEDYVAAKRSRLNSFTSVITQETSTINATVLPSAAAILPKISEETLQSICKYHGNMVRKFPKKERTPKDQERRNKNTIACRMSRRVKKLEHIAIEEQYKEFSKQTFDIIEQSMRATAYLHELMKLSACPEMKTKDIKAESPQLLIHKTSTTVQQKKPFTIAFLTGNE